MPPNIFIISRLDRVCQRKWDECLLILRYIQQKQNEFVHNTTCTYYFKVVNYNHKEVIPMYR